jgi:hypothetical protein
MCLRIAVFIFVVLSGLSSAQKTSPVVKDYIIPAKTSLPFTYCIDYTPAPDADSYIKNLKNSPPDLFHVGYHIPFKAALGPTYGHELYSNDILTPQEIGREIGRIKNLIEKMRNSGVNRLIPYVYTMAFFGVPDKRSGFFKFYDHWDDYRQFGLGAKPEADPILWEQVRQPAQLGGGPTGILHYEPCINHPGWSDYLDLVVRQLATVGYDGMFFDVNTLLCYCPHCQEKFDIYLLNKYGTDGLLENFGTADHQLINIPTIYRDFEDVILGGFKPFLAAKEILHANREIPDLKDTSAVQLENDWRLLRCFMQNSVAEFPPQNDLDHYLKEKFGTNRSDNLTAEKKQAFIQTVLRYHFLNYLQSAELAAQLEKRFGSADIGRRCCGTPRDLLLWVETQRFWCQSMADQFARLKTQGRITYARQRRAADFYTVANLGSMATLDGLNKRRVDGIDLVHWAPAADMQMLEEMNQVGILESGVIFSNIFAFKWAMAAGTRAGSLLYKVVDDRAADLAEAEVSAAGGGAFIQPGTGAPASRLRWNHFFTDNASLWQNGDSWSQVGLLFWSDQVFYENSGHLASTRALVHILSENQIPFDIITEENMAGVNPYRLLIAPQLRYLDPQQINLLSDYANQGGNLIIIQPFGSEDKYARKQESGLLPRPAAGQKAGSVKHGLGSILWLDAGDVPDRRSDFWALMEERGNDFGAARIYLNAAREKDTAEGVDLGSAFVARIENAFQLKLRWCPAETDDAVYIQAYRLPAKGEEKEKVVLHAVNYHMPIQLAKEAGKKEDPVWMNQTRSGEPLVTRNLTITIPLPASKKISSVSTKSPTDNQQQIKWKQEGDKVELIISALQIYQAVILEMN